MKVKTRHTHAIALDDGREFELPIVDPYDNTTVEETMIVTERDDGTTLSYLVTDDSGRDWRDLGDEVFMGWEYTNKHFKRWSLMSVVLDSQRDADKLSGCDSCGYAPSDHDSEEDLDDIGCEGYVKPRWRDLLEQGRAFLFEKYEHGLVRYALQGEASMVDRQWDVSPVAGIMVADDDWGADVDLEQAARRTLETFTDWCNGAIYGIVHAHYTKDGTFIDEDSCWGYIGADHALACLKEETA